jgi:carbamoyltransferase
MIQEDELVIGANFLSHDSAVFAIDVHNRRVFGMSTERITRYKHDTLPPIPVIRELIREFGLDPSAIRLVTIATPLQTQLGSQVERELYTARASLREALNVKYLSDVVRELERYSHVGRLARLKLLLTSPAGCKYLMHRIRMNGKTTTFQSMVATEVNRLFPQASVKVRAFDHHLAHATGAYFLSGFTNPLNVTLDGWGDGIFSKVFVGDGAGLKEVSASRAISVRGSAERLRLDGPIPSHVLATGIFNDLSLGHFYSIITWLLGFEPVSDEGKVEALAAYGTPENEFLTELCRTVRLDEGNASLVVSESDALALYFDILKLQNYVRQLGKEAVAAAAQRFLEERSLELIACLLKRWPRSSIVLSGGCVANVILNMHIYEQLCENIFVMPAMGDDGIALGTCALALMELGVPERDLAFLQDRQLPYFGNHHPRTASEKCLARFGDLVAFEDRSQDWPETVAALLIEGEIGAIYQGPMEWGPRALGNRSILADPRMASMRERINNVVKKRPLFQPFCPSVLVEEKDRLFERAYINRHMTCAFRMRREFWEKLPSAIHIDGTARAQFVSADDNPLFYRVLAEFKRLSGFGVLINTSFNLHGRTIVNTPEDAIEDFLDSHMDFLVLDGYLVRHRNTLGPGQPKQGEPVDTLALSDADGWTLAEPAREEPIG